MPRRGSSGLGRPLWRAASAASAGPGPACASGTHSLLRCLGWRAASSLASARPPPLDAPPQPPCRRVVVTGLGLVTPLGVGVASSWPALLSGATGIRALSPADVALPGMSKEDTAHCFTQLPSRVGGIVPGFGNTLAAAAESRREDVEGGTANGAAAGPRTALYLSQLQRQLPRCTQFALQAAGEALADAEWVPVEEESGRERTGVAIGAGIGPVGEIAAAGQLVLQHRLRRLSPHFVPRVLINMAAGHVSIKYGLQGPNHSAATACATGAHGVGDAFRMIQHGDADVMLAGGTESCVDALSIAGFSRLRALSTSFNDTPAAASRPFDRSRDGFVIAEGCGVLVLEELEHALGRGAPRVYAEVRGYGMSGDGHHITQPTPDGRGASLAMARALHEAGLAPEAVGYVNAHATSTPLGDEIEARAIKAVLGSSHVCDEASFALSSTKGATGHLLGAAGAVEAVFTILALHYGVAPPSLNLDAPDAVFQGGFAPSREAKRMPGMQAAVSNSFGFGGTNSCLAFGLPPSL